MHPSKYGCLTIVALTALSTTALAADSMIEVEFRGRRVEGLPLAWSDRSVALLARDGHLWQFAPDEVTNFRETAASFRGYSPGELRGRLMHEFGRQFDISGTGQYLVVHPAGKRDVWAQRFEELYRSFVQYFSVRGFQLQSPQVPLVAIVFHSQRDFARYAEQTGYSVSSGVLGFYSPTSNRILMYAPDDNSSGSWQEAAETIIHEAAHQSAFNTGVHSRYTMPPRWLGEGLGTMFEARGVWNSRLYPRRQDRINRLQLDTFRRYAPARRMGTLAHIVSDDRAFYTSSNRAYAEAWALTFFLAETRPRQYTAFLQKTAARPAFTSYLAPQRVKDFTDVFGSDLGLIEAQMLRFIEGLK